MSSKTNIKLILALFSIAFCWGTTYLAIRIGVETIPPILVCGLRNLLAGTILLIYLVINKQLTKMNPLRIKQNLIVSFMLIILANGLTTFSEKYISSGLAALIASLSPLVILLFNLGLRHEKFSSKILIGIFLAVGGISLIYQTSIEDFFNPDYHIGIMAILGAVLAWSTGTIYSKSQPKYTNGLLLDSCIQMYFAGFFLISLQFIVQPQIQLDSWTFHSIWAVVYLAIFGSILGYISYIYALTQLPSTKVSIVTYINVVVALFLGWLILKEEVTMRMILAVILILSGVITANYSEIKLWKKKEL